MHAVIIRVLFVFVGFGLLSGCGLKYTVKDPAVSNMRYNSDAAKPVVLKVDDQRTDLVFHDKISSLKNVSVELVNMKDPIAWLSQALQKEFIARGVPLTVVGKDAAIPADVVLTVKKYQITSRRVSGFSPWESYHSFSGQVTAGEKTCDVRAYFFNGRLPAWSMSEVEEPCFNMPASILVKEIASKINNCVLHYSASDQTVNDIEVRAREGIAKHDETACFSMIELGSTGNPAAMQALIKFSDADERITRACALSSIGTLGADEQISFLKMKYEQFEEIDKFMALKSIGDIGTPEAVDFVRKAKEDKQYDREYGLKYCVDLYLAR